MGKRIAVLSTYDAGGAAELTYRIVRALSELGHEAVLLVKQRTRNSAFVVKVPYQASRPNYLTPVMAQRLFTRMRGTAKQLTGNREPATTWRTDPAFHFYSGDETVGLRNTGTLLALLPFKPDLVIAGWVSGFLNTRNLQELGQATKAPVYWLTTDMAPLTGGCHYAWDCAGYTRDCANCPAILTDAFKQVAKRNLALKKHHVQAGNIQVLAGSEWCRQQAVTSTLFRRQATIPVLNGPVDQHIFNSRCRDVAKQVFGVAAADKLIFSGATFTHDKRKGITYLVESLRQLYASLPPAARSTIKVLIAGSNVLENELVRQIPFGVVPLDFITDDRLLSLAYQAADLFVCSSVEDAGPMMVTEALACGTPVVGFELGFVADIVESGKNGFRVPVRDTGRMAACMQAILTLSRDEAAEFSRAAVRAIDEKASLRNLAAVIEQLTVQGSQPGTAMA